MEYRRIDPDEIAERFRFKPITYFFGMFAGITAIRFFGYLWLTFPQLRPLAWVLGAAWVCLAALVAMAIAQNHRLGEAWLDERIAGMLFVLVVVGSALLAGVNLEASHLPVIQSGVSHHEQL